MVETGMGIIMLGSKRTFALTFAFLTQTVLWLCVGKKKKDAMMQCNATYCIKMLSSDVNFARLGGVNYILQHKKTLRPAL